MLSNPMNAHDEMTAVLTICLISDTSGAKAGCIVVLFITRPATAHTAMLSVNRATSTDMTFPAAFALHAHRRPAKIRTAMDSSASPRYTSYPNTVYSLPNWKKPPMNSRPNSGRAVALAQSIARYVIAMNHAAIKPYSYPSISRA